MPQSATSSHVFARLSPWTARLALLAEHESAGEPDDSITALVTILVEPLFDTPYSDGSSHYARFLERVRNHPVMAELTLTAEQWPATRADFEVYWNTACGWIQMDDHIREFLLYIVDLKMINIVPRIILAPLLRFLTIGFLAPVFRDNLGLEWSATDQRRFEHLFLFVSFVNRFLPKFVRTHNYTVLMTDLRWRLKHKKPLI